ncbi:hypothetical protein Pro02_65040 [Planobispora rosea]|uniref:Uncharacterized protein n=1 Tax=Planobispora rosea TaxID=35762 RepID=A0A8J3WHR0_PLARO|nr:hypothetical protein Pro02_65040 [Planobispora rosea]
MPPPRTASAMPIATSATTSPEPSATQIRRTPPRSLPPGGDPGVRASGGYLTVAGDEEAAYDCCGNPPGPV